MRVCMSNGTVHGLTTLPPKSLGVYIFPFPFNPSCLVSHSLSLSLTDSLALSRSLQPSPTTWHLIIHLRPHLHFHLHLHLHLHPHSCISKSPLHSNFPHHPPTPSRTPKTSHHRRQFSPAAPKDATVHFSPLNPCNSLYSSSPHLPTPHSSSYQN